LAKIINHNAEKANKSGFELTLNMFGDLTLPEVRSLYTGFRIVTNISNLTQAKTKQKNGFQKLRIPRNKSEEEELKTILKIADYIGLILMSVIFSTFCSRYYNIR
jgi:hypothetical protein